MAESKLAAIVEQFADLEPRERLEELLDYAEGLPPLPQELAAERDAGLHRVPECMTPVFLWIDVREGRVHVTADVAPEAPTVKGFVAILVDAFDGATPAEVLGVSPTLLSELGLVEALGMTRMRGLTAILGRIQREVRAAA